MGYNIGELREIRAQSIGAETMLEASEVLLVKPLINQFGLKPALSAHDYAVLARYVKDIGLALAEVSRVLRQGGRAVYVVGDCFNRGTFIPNSKIITAVALQHGLSLKSRQSRTLPANRRYLPPPQRGITTGTMDVRLRREVVLVFNKS